MYTQTLAGFIASTVDALKRCESKDNAEWSAKHRERLDYIARNLLPRGSGIDSGTTIDIDRCTQKKIVLHTSFHHMDDSGGYDGWSDHYVVAYPSFDGIDLNVSGENRNDIKDYLHDVFYQCLTETDSYDETRGEYCAPWYHRTEARAVK